MPLDATLWWCIAALLPDNFVSGLPCMSWRLARETQRGKWASPWKRVGGRCNHCKPNVTSTLATTTIATIMQYLLLSDRVCLQHNWTCLYRSYKKAVSIEKNIQHIGESLWRANLKLILIIHSNCKHTFLWDVFSDAKCLLLILLPY